MAARIASFVMHPLQAWASVWPRPASPKLPLTNVYMLLLRRMCTCIDKHPVEAQWLMTSVVHGDDALPAADLGGAGARAPLTRQRESPLDEVDADAFSNVENRTPPGEPAPARRRAAGRR